LKLIFFPASNKVDTNLGALFSILNNYRKRKKLDCYYICWRSCFLRWNNTVLRNAAVGAPEVRKKAAVTGGWSGCKCDVAKALGIFAALRKIPRSEHNLHKVTSGMPLFDSAQEHEYLKYLFMRQKLTLEIA